MREKAEEQAAETRAGASRRRALTRGQGLLSCEELQNVPFLIPGNKIDKGMVVSEEELKVELGITHTTGKGSSSL